jgi:DNA-binding response OmpR family regulator
MDIKRGTVLVIDDDQTFCEYLQEALSFEGYYVVVVPNGQVALKAVQEIEPSVILLDMQMPVLNGWAFLSTYCRQPDVKTPIIVMSGRASRNSNLPHVSGILPKPFKMQELMEMVARAI